jgi:hypothetical protein
VAKSAGFDNGSTSIKREAKLIRVIRAKLARVKVKRVADEKVLVEAGRGNGNQTRAQRIADPIVAKRRASPILSDQSLRRSAQLAGLLARHDRVVPN